MTLCVNDEFQARIDMNPKLTFGQMRVTIKRCQEPMPELVRCPKHQFASLLKSKRGYCEDHLKARLR